MYIFLISVVDIYYSLTYATLNNAKDVVKEALNTLGFCYRSIGNLESYFLFKGRGEY